MNDALWLNRLINLQNKANTRIITNLLSLKKHQIVENETEKAELEASNPDYVANIDKQTINFLKEQISLSIINKKYYVEIWKKEFETKHPNHIFLKYYEQFNHFASLKNVDYRACLAHDDLHDDNIIVNQDGNCTFIDLVLMDYCLVGTDLLHRLALHPNIEDLQLYLKHCNLQEAQTLYMLMYDFACSELMEFADQEDTRMKLASLKNQLENIPIEENTKNSVKVDFNDIIKWLEIIKDYIKKQKNKNFCIKK